TVGVESSSRELEETVRTLGGPPGRAFRDAWGAPALTGAAAGGVLTFALSALAFAAPIALGGPSNYTVEARVWSLDQVLADPSAASVVAAVAVALLAIPIAAYFLLLRRLAPRSGSVGRPPGPIARDDRSAWVLLGGLGMLGAIEAMVIGAVLMGLFDPASPGLGHDGAVGALFSPSVSAKLGLPLPEVLANSAVFSGLAASLALLLGLGLASGARGRGRWPADLLTVAPIGLLVVSPVVLALSLLTAGGPWVGASGIWILIVLGQALLALPFVAQSLGVALARVPANLREAAQSLGSSPGAAYLEVELPAARAAIAAAGLLAVALCIGEFTATYFLAIPRFTTATVALYRLTDARLVPEAGALAALLVLLSAGLLALASSGGRRVAL
ncbi:MAG: ABC transporter permease subunit, partial [Thermoplasmata archaeon]|nr:ABC transporter permease subunit [Thermoplasmata archaeon]